MTAPDQSPAEPTLSRGDRVPDVLLPDQDGIGISLYDKVRGKPIVVLFCADVAGRPARGALEQFQGWCGDGPDALAHCFVITRSAQETLAQAAGSRGFPGHFLNDVDESAARAFGISWRELRHDLCVFVLDPNQRVLEIFEQGCEEPMQKARARVESLSLFAEATQPRDMAPVLVIPRVFEPDFCARLIEAFHTRGHEESGVYSLEEGQLKHGVDHDMKKRFDHYVRDDDLVSAITPRLSRRVLPEVYKAFCYPVTKLEEFKIVCYRAETRGYFRPHRDNMSPQTLHRRFALTLNLNTGEYEGGELCFPEYGPHRYSPALGEAIVFSCSLLHEALDVTRGERYVLLAFLYGEDGARQKRKMQERMASMGQSGDP